DDARQALLQHVVGRADLDGVDRSLFTESARDEDEWHLGALFNGELERREAVEGRQRKVGENEVEGTALERRGDRLARLDARNLAGDAARLEHALDELGVPGVVLEVQDAQSGAHFLPMLPGGGSLITAQNTPSSLMALTNSWKSTGFTT